MKRILLILLLLVACLFTTTACKKNKPTEETENPVVTPEQSEEVTPTPEVKPTPEVTPTPEVKPTPEVTPTPSKPVEPTTPEVTPTPVAVQLATPVVTISSTGVASWDAVANATKYAYKLNGAEEVFTVELTVQLVDGGSISVKAVGDGVNYTDSEYTEVQYYSEPVPEVSQEELSKIRFRHQEVPYTGEPIYLEIENQPENTTVEYKGNGQVDRGVYTVTAIVKDLAGDTLREYKAILEIIDPVVDLSAVTFENKSFDFDGELKSIYVDNLPKLAVAEYENNEQILTGTYTVTAVISDIFGNYLTTKEANITIKDAAIDNSSYPYLKSIGINPTEVHNAYQLLVYSFYDSDGDGYGDLNGITMKLDYIKDLGADMIWLSPIMKAVSYHAYDVTSFYAIDPKLGTLADYKNLVNEAHKLGIKIILDMPINHTSPEHEWFKGYLNGDPRYAEYYQARQNGVNYGSGGYGTFYTDEATGKTYFGAFGPTMPDLNFQSAALRQGILEVFKYWIEAGADGFRLDAIKHIYDPNEIPSNQSSIDKNNAYFNELRSQLKGINPNIYLVGENFSGQGEVKQYASSFDAEFDFESWHTAIGAVNNRDPWGGSNNRIYFDDTIVGCTNELLSLNPNWMASFMTGNHDVTRVASHIADAEVLDIDLALKLYAALVTLRAGIPYVYYGDELGMYGQNKSGDDWVEDAELRLPMPFKDTTVDVEKVFYGMVVADNGVEVGIMGSNVKEDWPTYLTTCTYDVEHPYVEDKMADENSLYNVYKDLFAIRKQYPAIALGKMAQVGDYNGCATIISFTYQGQTIYVAFNFSEIATVLEDVTDGMVTSILYDLNGVEVVGGNDLQMSSRSVAIFTATGTMSNGGYSSTGSTEVPQSGFHLVINGNTYVALQENGKVTYDGIEFTEYKSLGVSMNAGDVVTLYNANAGESWAIQNPDQYSHGSWTGGASGITCNTSGAYDVYVKMAYGNDMIYFGPAA